MGGVRPWQTAGREIVCGHVSGWHPSAGTAISPAQPAGMPEMIKKDMQVVKHYHCNNSGGRLRNRSQEIVLQAGANWIIAR
jgi:hypothetical protein